MPLFPTPRHARRLRTHITLVFGSFAAVLVICLCLLGSEMIQQRLQQQAADNLRSVAHNAAVTLQQDLLQQIRRTQVLAKSRELWEQGLDSRSVALLLNRMQQINPHNVWIGVTDVHGKVLNASGDMLKGVSVAQRPWFQEAFSGPSISEVHTAKLLAELLPASASGEPLRLVDFSAPIHDPQGKLLGVLGIHGNWEWANESVERLLQGTPANNKQSIFIFDAKGQMMYAPEGLITPFTDIGQTLPQGINTAKPQPVMAQWKDAPTDFLTAAVRLPAPTDEHDLGWWVVARQPVQTAYADADRIVWLALAFAAVAAALAAAVAWRLARHVSNDLQTLAQASRQMAAAPGTMHLPILHSNLEVQLLSQSLHEMTQQLLDANTHMQEQVRLRTLELKQANTELERQANTDPLTKLLNRRGFEFQARLPVGLAQRANRPLSAVTIDIDFFKRINDTYGHDVGDVVLVSLAQLLLENSRQTDVCARFGGEEFVVLLPDTTHSAAMQWTEQLLQTIARTPLAKVGHITVSAGVSSLRAGTQDSLPELLKRSDDALYEAKHSGRNRVCMAT